MSFSEENRFGLAIMGFIAFFAVLVLGAILGMSWYDLNGPCAEQSLDGSDRSCTNKLHQMRVVPGYRVCVCPPYER